MRAGSLSQLRNFYPRSPCGERRGQYPHVRPEQAISIHALLAESDPGYYSLYPSLHYFYPRSPCGERLAAHSPTPRAATNFYPRSPCGERPWRILKDRRYRNDFYPRSPCGERPFPTIIRMGEAIFLSTLSLRRATQDGGRIIVMVDISIHALLAESDAEKLANKIKVRLFLSTLSLRRATRA